MREGKARPIAVLLASALALAVPGTRPAEAHGLGNRIGAVLNRGARATGRAAQLAGSTIGAAANRSLGRAQRKARGERGTHQAKPSRER